MDVGNKNTVISGCVSVACKDQKVYYQEVMVRGYPKIFRFLQLQVNHTDHSEEYLSSS
jgi:hypothetical protein